MSAPEATAPAFAPSSSSSPPSTSAESPSPRDQALSARRASLHLQSLPASTRTDLLQHFACLLHSNTSTLLAANARDVAAAESSSDLSPSLLARLHLTPSKLSQLHSGIVQIVDAADPLHVASGWTEVSAGLVLHQVTVPLGVLLVIFESRPDVYPQLVALAIKSGNAVMLKGGKEAAETLALMHALLQQAVLAVEKTGTGERGVLAGLVTLLEGRSSVQRLLALDDVIDLVIPRGSSSMVRSIQQTTHIPVMGHSEGVCHVVVDEDVDLSMAIPIIVDAKCDYPAACNAVECLLLHHSLAPPAANPSSPSPLLSILSALKAAAVTCYAGPALLQQCPGILPPMPHGFSHEYSSLELTVELTPSVSAAISHINLHSSHHTDALLTSSSTSPSALQFQAQVDSACVFVNASTRFADGYRFGLGAEVGISTGRLHARGPVGMEGLCTKKWLLVSDRKEGHRVGEHSEGKWQYSHRKMDSRAQGHTAPAVAAAHGVDEHKY